MLTKEQIVLLKKQLNVSKDADKTKDRVSNDYRAATKEQKKAIIEMSGQASSTIFRIYKMGVISARILVAMSQILNVQPEYYTGESDERTELTEEHLRNFLINHNYDALAKELGKRVKRPYNRKAKDSAVKKTPAIEASKVETPTVDASAIESSKDEEPTVTEDLAPSPINESANNQLQNKEPVECNTDNVKEITLVFADNEQMNKAVIELNEQEATELLHTLFIRAKGGGEAAALTDVVKRCLLK